MNDSFQPLLSLGWSDRWAALLYEVAPSAHPGRVVRRDRGHVLVSTGNAVTRVALDPAAPDLVTGDWVALDGDRVLGALPRTGALRRRAADGTEQLLAANVELVLLICGLDRPVKPGRIHRGAIQAWDAGAAPLVVLNKADVCDDPEEIRTDIGNQVPGLDVLAVSARTDQGLDALRRALEGRTAVLLGESGAGKSSLLNALAGHDLAAEGAVRRGDAKGRHTTVRRELHVLPGTGVVIDTPGIRAFGLAASPEAVDSAFAEVEELAARCRFADCRHDREPGCAVREATATGRLHPDRLRAYRKLQREIEGQVIRARPHERRRYERKFARVVRDAQRAKGRRDA